MATDPSAPLGGPPARPSSSRQAINPRLTAAIAVLVVIAVVVFLLTRGGSSKPKTASSPATATATTPPVTRAAATAATATSLRALQTSVGHTLYWAGPANGLVLTSQKASDGSVYVRYLTPGTDLNDPAQKWLSVVSYPEANAFALAQAGAKRSGARSRQLADGTLAVTPPKVTTNVFLSRPGSTVLVEVFDPSPGRALRDVTSGRIRPVQ